MIHRPGLFVALLLAAFLWAASGSAGAQGRAQNQPQTPPQTTIRFDLPAQPLEASLRSVGKSTDINILIDRKLVAGRRAPALNGEYSLDQAITTLLRGTGITHQFVNANTVVLAKAAEASAALERQDSSLESSTSSGLRMARADALQAGQASAQSSEEKSPTESPKEDAVGRSATEIVVTAQKRSELLQDVPVPVSVVNTRQLSDTNQLRLQDYFATIPGLNFQGSNGGAPQVSVRGISTGTFAGNPTVGVTIDDVPYGSSSTYGGLGVTLPDLDPSDLARIEVLRGPQGTLYGASSLGGLLKYVTVDPSMDRVSGRMQVGTSSIESGDGMGYNVRGVINVPLSETWAMRAGAFTRHDPGYIDDPVLGIEGVNDAEVYGGRVSTLWRPSEKVSLKLAALYEHIDAGLSNYVEISPTLGDLQQDNTVLAGRYTKRSQAYSALLTAQVGSAELTSVTGYNLSRYTDVSDSTDYYGWLPLSLFGVTGPAGDEGAGGARGTNLARTTKFTQEVRMSGPIGERFDWLAGAFYTHEKSRVIQTLTAVNPATKVDYAPMFLDAYWPTSVEEVAAFADLTVHFTDRFDVQFGGRQSRNRQAYSEIDAGLYGPVFFGLADPVINPKEITEERSFTYLVTPRMRFSQDAMLYARLASGYRVGGPNPTATLFGLPVHFKPDKSKNYEIGFKGSAFDRAVSMDVSVYYIDWQDIQLYILDRGSAFFTNAGATKSQGVELSVETHPATGLTISGWIAYNDAQLTEPFPPESLAYGEPGDRLPATPDYSGNLSVDRELPLRGDWTGSFGATLIYVGDRVGGFKAFGGRQPGLPSYFSGNLRARATFKSWTVNAFLNNVADERGVTNGDPARDYAFAYIPPRTLGVSLSKSF